MAIALFLNLKRKGEISVIFLYELLLRIVSLARGYKLCPSGNLQNNRCQNRKAPFEESGAETSSEADRQRSKGRRYRFIRIAFIIFIILLCLILAVASPLRCFALGYASETIVELILSALAGTAAYAFAAAGGAELIACLLIGMGASITVSVIAAAINTAVECGAWQDFVINCQNNFEIRKNQGTMALAMGGTAFLYAYDWVKEHILGISSDDSSVSPTFNFSKYGSSVYQMGGHGWRSDNSLTFRFSDFMTYKDSINFTYSDRGNFTHTFTYVRNDKLNTSVSCDVSTNKYYGGDYEQLFYHYTPIFNSKEIHMKTSWLRTKVRGASEDPVLFDFVTDGKIKTVSYVYNKKTYSFTPENFSNNSILFSDGSVCSLKLSSGKVVNSFDSFHNFVYLLTFKATDIICSTKHDDGSSTVNWSDTINGVVSDDLTSTVPTENKKYYDESKDTIATTAGSVRTKVKDGSITSDTDGKVTVKVNSPAIPTEGSPAIVTPETKINEPVKVTDISTTLEGVQTMNPGDAITIGSNNIQLGAQPMGDKLPFSALKTISNMMNTLFISKTDDNKVKAPVIPVDFKVMNQHIKFNIDFSPLDPYVGLVRIGLSVSFLITTYLCFKKWIVNKEL